MENPFSRMLWPLLASIAGSITALALAVGTFFGVFVGPSLVNMFTSSSDQHLQGACYYGLASGSNVLIPLFIKKVKGLIGLADETK